MKKCLLFFIIFSAKAFSFDPICLNPKSFSKDSIKHIFTNEVNLKENQLIIYSVNPPTPIDWSSPKSAFRSIFRNSFINEGYEVEHDDTDGRPYTTIQTIKTHFIGHMFMKLKCAGKPTVLTGMSSPGYEEIQGLMVDGKSFTQIISPTKGHFNTSEELQKEIDIRSQKMGNLSFMGINLNPNSCEELLKYLTEFHACGVDQRYGGLNANPHRGEGAGCSAFGLSFLQRLNIMPMIDDIKSGQFGSQFLRKINIPKNMLKYDNKDPDVGAWGLLRGKDIPWATNAEEGKLIRFFDPELFSQWVKDVRLDSNNSTLVYKGRDKNKLINGVWFEEAQTSIEPSLFSIDYLK